MTIPLYLSVATIVLSFFAPKNDKDQLTTKGTSFPTGSTITFARNTLVSHVANTSFVFGLIVGSGLFGFISAEFRRRRVLAKCRRIIDRWIKGTTNGRGKYQSDSYRTPTQVKDHEVKSVGVGQDDDDRNELQRTLVSPYSSLTSTLNVSVLEIPPGKEIVPKPAVGVECYYVIQGDGVCTLDSCGETRLSEGEAFVVDPGSTRGLSNPGRRSLRLVRATDAAFTMQQDGFDVTRSDSSGRSTMLSRVSNEILNFSYRIGNLMSSQQSAG